MCLSRAVIDDGVWNDALESWIEHGKEDWVASHFLFVSMLAMRINITCKNQKNSQSKINLIPSYLYTYAIILGGKDGGM